MALLIEKRQNGWIFELTCSSRKTAVCPCSTHCHCRCLQPHSLGPSPASTLPSDTGSKVNTPCPSTCASEQPPSSIPLQGDSPKLSRQRRPRRLLRKMLGLSRRTKANQLYHPAELDTSVMTRPQVSALELPTVRELTELESPSRVSACELPAEPFYNPFLSPLYSNPGRQQPHPQTDGHHPMRRCSVVSSPGDDYLHYPIQRHVQSSAGQSNLMSPVSYPRRLSFTSPEVSPIQDCSAGQPLPLTTGMVDQGPSLSECPPMSESSSTIDSASPMNSRRHSHEHEPTLYDPRQTLQNLPPGELPGCPIPTPGHFRAPMALGDILSAEGLSSCLQWYKCDPTAASTIMPTSGYLSTPTGNSSFNADYSPGQDQTQYAIVGPCVRGTTASSTYDLHGYVQHGLHIPVTEPPEALPDAASNDTEQQMSTEQAGQATPTQNSRYNETSVFELFLHQHNEYSAPPAYTPPSLVNLLTHEEETALITQRSTQNRSNSSSSKPKRKKARRASINPSLFFPPLPCEIEGCDEVFNGRYQRGNRKRHLRNMHAASPILFTCRHPTCLASYQRADARRKHEWNIHQMQACKPKKRKGGKIYNYMPRISV